METQPTFPESRLIDPKRQAELAVYRDLAASALLGMALYSARPGPHAPEVDFAVWLQRIARFVLEVKGGRYRFDGGVWLLDGPGGAMPKANPLMQAWDGAMALRNFLGERLGQPYSPFVIPVVVFPDMEQEPAIEALTAGGQGHVLFGAGDVAGRLAAIAADVQVKYPPSGEDVQRETALLWPGPESASSSTVEGHGDGLEARQVIIQHVDTVNLYTGTV